MKERIKTFFCVIFLLTALPYIITMCFEHSTDASESLNEEEYLIGVVADEIPITYEREALKAQAVLAQTNIRSALEKGEELPESVSEKELLRMWGKEGFSGNYRRLADAIKDTEGIVMTFQGNYVYAAFHAVSAGRTRDAVEALGSKDMPWLAGADSWQDIPSEDYLTVIFLEKGRLVQLLEEKLMAVPKDKEHPLEGFEIVGRDGADYVTQVKIGDKTVSGEEFRNALNLSSACFYIKEAEGEIRIVTKGLGHGLGLSQYGANELAAEGMTYTDILSYYFKNVEISD